MRRAGPARRRRRRDGRVDGARGTAWRPDRDAARRVRGGPRTGDVGRPDADQPLRRTGRTPSTRAGPGSRSAAGGRSRPRPGRSCSAQAGALWFTGEDRGFVDATVPTFEALGIPIEVLSPAEVSGRWPQIATGDITGAVYEPEAGLLMAARGCVAATRRLVELRRLVRDRRACGPGRRTATGCSTSSTTPAAVRRGRVRVRGRAVAAAPVPGRRRRARQRHEAGRRLPRARRPATSAGRTRRSRAGST